MFQKDTSNTIFQLAFDLVNDTSRHVFLTGKAGTGKTTFLKYIREQTGKNCITVAPTGVAAINAGGSTMHSFFQLPRGVFVPGTINRETIHGGSEVTDRHSLFRNIHFSANKRKLLQELELLIIDEVSMMRCDMLDAMDLILRHFRKATHLPFGGVQVLYIGDLFQLPPVVMQDEWKLLSPHYESPYFFDAKVIREAPPLYIELKKIYRQNEKDFIDVLNRIRNNMLLPGDYDFLNTRYVPGFTRNEEEQYITITTHNRTADQINAEELSRLPGKLYSFEASVNNDFSDKAFPTDRELKLKEGAQVMFIKNDSSAERRYFNGKLATVRKISEEGILVGFHDDAGELELEKETWRNLRYVYNKELDQIDEEELGSFTQYPIRLAWAITIHKSQGLTFEKAVIDAGASFAPGQVYVALSRCVSMEGIVLKSKILPQSISMDKRILQFSEQECTDPGTLGNLLENGKRQYHGEQLLRLFDLDALHLAVREWQEVLSTKKVPDATSVYNLVTNISTNINEWTGVARKFKLQLSGILEMMTQSGEVDILKDRVNKAILFFASRMHQEILLPVRLHLASIKYAARLLEYKKIVYEVELSTTEKLKRFSMAHYGDLKFEYPQELDFMKDEPVGKKVREKTVRGSTRELSFQFFREGKSIQEIAGLRNLAPSTIISHMAYFIGIGQMKASELLSEEKIDAIIKVIEQEGDKSSGMIKSKLGEEFTYSDIQLAISHFRFLQGQPA